MSAVKLLQPILDEELQRNNFFNGRLLSAEDLRAEQKVSQAERALLGRAVGDGVAWGLRVSSLSLNPARVKVTRGVALDLAGDLLRLSEDAEVTLVPAAQVQDDSTGTGLFANCEPIVAQTPIVVGAYVLVISPASGFRDRALVSDPNATMLGRGTCGPRFTVEGVRFRLVALTLSNASLVGQSLISRISAQLPPNTDVKAQHLRNLLAHACFATETLRDYFETRSEPVGTSTTPAGWGAIDAMRYQKSLTDCDVPLAIVVFKSDGGMSFVDMWSVRRHLIDAGAIESWRVVAGPRRIAEGQAAFLQFQAQLDVVKGLESSANLASVAATKYLDFLPPAGWLPTGTGGFNWRTFLGAHAPPEVAPVDAALLRGILERSWLDESFLLDTSPPVPVRVYGAATNQSGAVNPSFVVFARERTGSLRVTLDPAPGANVKPEVRAVAKAGGRARGTTINGAVVPIPGLHPGPHRVFATMAGYEPDAMVETTVIGGRTVDVTVKLTPLPNGAIVVTAVDVKGNSVANATIVATSTDGITRTSTPISGGKYRIADLPPAKTFTLKGNAAGYKETTKAPIGPVAAGEEKTAVLVFEATSVPKTQPSRCIFVAKVNEPALQNVRLCMVLAATEFEQDYFYGEAIKKAEKRGRSGTEFRVEGREKGGTWKDESERYLSYTGQIVYTKALWENMKTLMPASPAVNQWLLEWAQWLAQDLDDEAIAKANPIVKLDPKYKIPKTPNEMPTKPPAYAVFGTFGIPLVIQPDSAITPVPVPNGKEYFPYLPEDWFEIFCRYAMCEIDDFPFLWEEIMVDLTRDPPELVREIMDEARKKVEEIIKNRTYLPGVDEDKNVELTNKGYPNNVSLANGLYGDLAGNVEKNLTTIMGSKAAAMKLIQTVRFTVPRDSWSLDSLNLSEKQEQELTLRGITSLGEFTAYASVPGNKADLERALGFDAITEPTVRDAALNEMIGDAAVAMGKASIEIGAKTAVNELGLNPVVEAKLNASGLGTVDALSNASTEEVMTATNLPRTEADKLIETATEESRAGKTIDTVVGVTNEEAEKLNEMVSGDKETPATLNEVLEKGADAVGAAIGDPARGAVLYNTLKLGVESTRTISNTTSRNLTSRLTASRTIGETTFRATEETRSFEETMEGGPFMGGAGGTG